MNEKRLAVLEEWQHTHGSSATYEKLIDALLKIKMRRLAEFVCSLVKPPSAGLSRPPVQKPVANPSPAQTFPMASSQLPPVPISLPRRLEVDDSGTPSPDTPTEFSQFGAAPQPSVHPPLSDKLSSDFQAKGLGSNDTPCFARQHWKLSELPLTGEGTTLAILDTGIIGTHFAFKSKFVAWRNFCPGQLDVTDSDGHGTQCAGIAAGIAYGNAAKVIFPGGVAPGAQLIICRVAQTKNDFNRQAIHSALDWLILQQQANQRRVDVISMSFGFDLRDQVMEEKIGYLIKMGTICVAAAGNDGRKEDIKYPAKINDVLCIGAHDSLENRAPFSPVGREMDFLAPGVNIRSPSIAGNDALIVGGGGGGGGGGTSCATPAVAGLICLLIECANRAGSPANEGIHDAKVIHELLKEMSTSRGESTHFKAKYGHGALKPLVFFDRSIHNWSELHRVIKKIRSDLYP